MNPYGQSDHKIPVFFTLKGHHDLALISDDLVFRWYQYKDFEVR